MKWLKNIISHIPIIAGSSDATFEDFREAGKEAFLATLCSLLPLIISIIYLTIKAHQTEPSLFDMILNNINKGELLLCATSIIAPVAYLVLSDPPKERRYVSRYSHGIILLAIILLSTIAFVTIRASASSNSEAILMYSLLALSFSIVTLFFSCIQKNINYDPERLKRSEDAFTEMVHRHRSGQ